MRTRLEAREEEYQCQFKGVWQNLRGKVNWTMTRIFSEEKKASKLLTDEEI